MEHIILLGCRVAAVLQLQFLAHVMLFPMLNISRVCISTFPCTSAGPSITVFCSFFISCFPSRLLRYFLNDFDMVAVAPVITGIFWDCSRCVYYYYYYYYYYYFIIIIIIILDHNFARLCSRFRWNVFTNWATVCFWTRLSISGNVTAIDTKSLMVLTCTAVFSQSIEKER